MGIDTEAQMVASILAKKRTAGASHALIDIPVGPSAKVRSRRQAERLANAFRAVGREVGVQVEVVETSARGPVGSGVGPRLEALDVLSVLRRETEAPVDLREKSLYLAARILEQLGAVRNADGYRVAREALGEALDSGAAEAKFEELLDAQGRRSLPGPAPHRAPVSSPRDGRIREIDCFEISKVAKLAGAPAHPAAGVRVLRRVDDVVSRSEPLFEIHAQSRVQLDFAREYAEARPGIVRFGY
jgi:thymidine phosphorylase